MTVGIVLALSACSSPASEPTEDEEIPDPAASEATNTGFDVALVISNFSAECPDPLVVDELFCQQVVVDDMTADGTTLTVPTLINGTGMEERAAVICDQFAVYHFDGETAEPLGYETIIVLDREGNVDATCSVPE